MFGFEESFGYLSGTDVRDKDGVNACMLIAEAACWYKKTYGCTLVDAIDTPLRAVRLLRRQGNLLRAAGQGRSGKDAVP